MTNAQKIRALQEAVDDATEAAGLLRSIGCHGLADQADDMAREALRQMAALQENR